MADILFYPPFPARPALFDQLYRTIWNFLPAIDRIGRMIFPYAGDDFALLDAEQSLTMANVFLARHFDPAIAGYATEYSGKISFVADPEGDPARYTAPLRGVIVWSGSDARAVSRAQAIAQQTGAEVIYADPLMVQQETLAIIAFVYKLFSGAELGQLAAQSAETFFRYMPKWRGRPIAAFGNGPSLAGVVSEPHTWGNALRIICNSTIADSAALAALAPEVLVCGDPIQHCGCSLYAGRFRADLATALADPDRVLMTQLGYVPYFKRVLPAEAHGRIVGVGLERRTSFNIDLTREFAVTATANIFTMLVLPLALTLAPEIDIYGCDGMPLAQATKPWSHAGETDYMGKMAVTHRVHPAFWRRNYEEEFLSYCIDIEDIISAGEQNGKKVRARTPSYVPGLAKRFAP
jgi:hypothetical protein